MEEPKRINCKIKAKQPEEVIEPVKPAQLAAMYFSGQISLSIYNAIMNSAENARMETITQG